MPAYSYDGINYDQYGGFADLDFEALGGVYMTPPHIQNGNPVPGFRLGMIGPQWTMVDPEGKVFVYKGVFRISRSGDPHILGGTNQNGRSLVTTIQQKYPSTAAWIANTTDRLRKWHYNVAGPFSDTVYGDFPFLWHTGISMYARHKQFALDAGLTDAVKDISRCMKQNAPGASDLFYRPSGASAVGWPDSLDPKYSQFITQSINGMGLHPMMVGYAFEESDCVSRWFASGHPDERAAMGAAGIGTSGMNLHLGMGILWSNLVVTSSVSPRDGSLQTYTDTTNYSKKKLIDNLKAKYVTIANLNAAWNTGGYYTSFDSDGGWGVGTGVADEDGLRPRAWFGAGSATHVGHSVQSQNNVVNSMSWNANVKIDLDQIYSESVAAWLKPAWDAIKAKDPGLLFAPVNNWGIPMRSAAIGPLSQYSDFFTGGSLVNIRADVDYPASIAGPHMNWMYSVIPKPHIAGWYSAPGRHDSCLYYLGNNYTLSHTNSALNENNKLRNFTFAYQTDSGIYPHIGYTKWGYNDQRNESLAWGLISLNDNPYAGGDRTFAQGDPWAPGRSVFTEDQIWTDYLGYGGTTTLQRSDLIVGANIALKGIFETHFGDTPPPEEFMAILNVAIQNQDQEHPINYNGVRVRFQRSVDGGVTFSDVQSAVRPLGTATDSYSVPVGQSGQYRAGAALTDGTVLGTEVFSNAVQLAVFVVSTPQTITLAIG